MTEAYQQLKKRADTGWEALANGSPIRIMVGVATCGRAAGGLQVIDAFEKAIAANGVEARVHRDDGDVGLRYVCGQALQPFLGCQHSGMVDIAGRIADSLQQIHH